MIKQSLSSLLELFYIYKLPLMMTNFSRMGHKLISFCFSFSPITERTATNVLHTHRPLGTLC